MRKSTAVWLAAGTALCALVYFVPFVERGLFFYGCLRLSGDVLCLARGLD